MSSQSVERFHTVSLCIVSATFSAPITAASAVADRRHMGAIYLDADWKTAADRPADGQQTQQQIVQGVNRHGA